MHLVPEVAWIFNRETLIKPSTYFQPHLTPDGRATLSIAKAFPEDVGEYTIQARSPAGVAEKTARLDVIRKSRVFCM